MQKMQNCINKIFFVIFLIAYIGGILLYDVISTFDYMDEAYVSILLVMFLVTMIKQKDWEINKVFLLIIAIFIFYLLYSFQIKSNSKRAIITDFLIQSKPYWAFFFAYQMKPKISEKQKLILNRITLICWVLLIPIGILGFIDEHSFKYTLGHPTNYAGAIACTSLIYLFTSENTKRNRYIFILLLAAGILSGRSKFYGFFVLSSAFILYFNDIKRLKFNYKTFFSMIFILAAIIFVAREKIQYYFINDLTGNTQQTDELARMVIYGTSVLIFLDYFPFGCGFASFGTYASSQYYSHIYNDYGIDIIWGLSKEYPKFISDTYYPSLAQFGIVGVILYIAFWVYIIRKALSLKINNSNIHSFSVLLSAIGFILIENIADACFTGFKGTFMMLLIGYLFSNLRWDSKETEKELTESNTHIES